MSSPNTIMDKHRLGIDQIDRQIITLLGERMAISTLVGIYKAANNIPVRDKEREGEILEELEELGSERNVTPELIREAYEVILKESRRLQTEVINGSDEES